MKRSLALFSFAIAVGGAALRTYVYLALERPIPANSFPVRIDVNPGEPFRAVAGRLEALGVIPSARAVALWARLRGIDRQIQHGAYQFTEPIAPIALLDKMRSGEAMVIRVTIPEGVTAREVAAILDHEGLCAESELLALVHDPVFAQSLGVAAPSLEGYLFPDTYFFSPIDSTRTVLAALVRRFSQVFGPEMMTRAQSTGLTPHQAVTLASLIEKETAKTEERPIVAAVFRNRLRKNMPLQADPSVIYGIDDFDGDLTRRDLETPTPYNTYTFVGLPPGPIANPGRTSLLAALYPADVDYLYFVARDDGSHEFSTNLTDHNRAVNRYQRHRRSQQVAG